MIHDASKESTLDDRLFASPTPDYRGAPFWAWNGKLQMERLSEQIAMLQKMGFGGFHMHVRTGMDTVYLSPEYMGFIRHCTEEAKARGMLAWLYDEDRWPSGTAGGKITAEHPEYAKKQLLFTPVPYSPDRTEKESGSVPGNGGCGRRYENGTLLAVYDILLDEQGNLSQWVRADADGSTEAFPGEGVRWYAYLESATKDPWFNDQPYVDTLNREAVRAFLQDTHEKYAGEIGETFGKTVPAIFTDEPQYTHKGCLSFPTEKKDVFIPWTTDLEARYSERYHEALLDRLPLLFWESTGEEGGLLRWRYQNLLSDLFRDRYCRQIGEWCSRHSLYLTGHVNGEETLQSQTANVGDAMRCYPAFGIPGIDMLCDYHQYNTAKQAQSIVRQENKPGMLSELYGVTGWDYDFRGYKLQGDWQAALGVTVRVPHLTWMTMKGEAKRDYPASIGYQSPWWDQFSIIENHFARINTVLTRGQAVCRVAVIHPIESYWMLWGPSLQTAGKRDRMEKHFAELTETLLFGQIDFDFISEACLPDQCAEGSCPLSVGQMSYDTVLVSGCVTLRRTTYERLRAFQKAGGRLIFLGECPACLDGVRTQETAAWYAASEVLPFDRERILDALEKERLIDIRREDGRRADRLLYQLRQDQGVKWLFLANGKNPVSPDVDSSPVYRISIRGSYRLVEYDTLTGEIRPLAGTVQDGCTVFSLRWHLHSSLLLRLDPWEAGQESLKEAPEEPLQAGKPILHPVAYRLEEPNMYLLDMAEWALDDGPLQPMEELLRLDNMARDILRLPRRRKAVVQPYLLPEEKPEHELYLRFAIPSEVEAEEVSLALEECGKASICWNGRKVDSHAADGWFVDVDIPKLALGKLLRGENVLEVRIPFGQRTNLENMYLLGQFGVQISGCLKTVVRLPSALGFGDIVPQHLPFYTGNLQYCFTVDVPGDRMTVRVPHYRGGLVRVLVDGKDCGSIVFSPYALKVTGLVPGKHELVLRLFGNRQNGFGQLHHTPGVWFYQSPDSWRSTGDLWRYEYQFKPLGILKAPEIAF